MKKRKFLVSLCTKDNNYQVEQALEAERVGLQLGIDVEIIYANNDAIHQTQQLLEIIQGPAAFRPDGILCESVGNTGLPVVATTAGTAGIGWVLLNRQADYIHELRHKCKIPAFCVTTDHDAVGRIQGEQFAALLPKGGTVLYIQGPAESPAAQVRAKRMSENKPANIQIRTLKAQWTQESAKRAVQLWMQMSGLRDSTIDVIGCQDDSMALGAREAFKELADAKESARWLSLPFTGCDGLPTMGQKWVDQGLLAATVIIPPKSGIALKMLAQAMETGQQPPVNTLIKVSSYMPKPKHRDKGSAPASPGSTLQKTSSMKKQTESSFC